MTVIKPIYEQRAIVNEQAHQSPLLLPHTTPTCMVQQQVCGQHEEMTKLPIFHKEADCDERQFPRWFDGSTVLTDGVMHLTSEKKLEPFAVPNQDHYQVSAAIDEMRKHHLVSGKRFDALC